MPMANSTSTAGNGGKEAGHAGPDIQADLAALREDVARLARQVGDIFAAHGNEAWQRARASVDEALTGAEDVGREAVDAVRDIGDNFRGAVDESLQRRPYATLALAFVVGFLLGATRR